MARTKYVSTLVAAGTAQTAGAENFTRGTVDVRSRDGGIITMKIINLATGPATQCEGRVLIAHDVGATPAEGSAGAVWKTLYRFGGGTTASAVTETSFEFGPGIAHIEVEFNGNTTQNVTVEAFATTVDYEAA